MKYLHRHTALFRGEIMHKPGPRHYARFLLAGIRIFNGTLGLVAPQLLIKRIDPLHGPNAAAVYAFRMFGIRTILIGLDLITTADDDLQRVLRQAVLIHGSDVATAAMLGAKRLVPFRTSALLTAISSLNVLLSLVAIERKG